MQVKESGSAINLTAPVKRLSLHVSQHGSTRHHTKILRYLVRPVAHTYGDKTTCKELLSSLWMRLQVLSTIV